MAPIPDEKRPAALTIEVVEREGGQIVCRPLVVTGPIRLFVVDGPKLPPELLERLIVIPNDPEARHA
jgi:hypothetical protein